MLSSISRPSKSSSVSNLFHQCITHFYQTILDKNLAGITLTYDLTRAVILKNSTQKSEWLSPMSTSCQPPITSIHNEPLCRIQIPDITKHVSCPSMHHPSLMSLVYYPLLCIELSWMTTSQKSPLSMNLTGTVIPKYSTNQIV